MQPSFLDCRASRRIGEEKAQEEKNKGRRVFAGWGCVVMEARWWWLLLLLLPVLRRTRICNHHELVHIMETTPTMGGIRAQRRPKAAQEHQMRDFSASTADEEHR